VPFRGGFRYRKRSAADSAQRASRESSGCIQAGRTVRSHLCSRVLTSARACSVIGPGPAPPRRPPTACAPTTTQTQPTVVEDTARPTATEPNGGGLSGRSIRRGRSRRRRRSGGDLQRVQALVHDREGGRTVPDVRLDVGGERGEIARPAAAAAAHAAGVAQRGLQALGVGEAEDTCGERRRGRREGGGRG
jgi:hypothetical protein